MHQKRIQKQINRFKLNFLLNNLFYNLSNFKITNVKKIKMS